MRVNRFVALRPGDIIEVVAPASACSPGRLRAGVEALERAGYVPRVPVHLFGRKYLYAHDDRERWKQLREALTRLDSRAVWCVRGGYGSARLLPRLARLRRTPPAKTLIGFSDLTALLNFVLERWGWMPLHGPVLAQLGSGALARESCAELGAVLAGRTTELVFEGLEPLNRAARAPGERRGLLVGGNLKTIQSLIGTPWGVRAAGRVLVLEDTAERGYAVDRMLVQLAQSGVLRGVRAIVLGGFSGGDEPDGSNRIEEVMAAFAAATDRPVLRGLEIGHHAAARALPLGAMASLRLGRRPRLRVSWAVEG